MLPHSVPHTMPSRPLTKTGALQLTEADALERMRTGDLATCRLIARWAPLTPAVVARVLDAGLQRDHLPLWSFVLVNPTVGPHREQVLGRIVERVAGWLGPGGGSWYDLRPLPGYLRKAFRAWGVTSWPELRAIERLERLAFPATEDQKALRRARPARLLLGAVPGVTPERIRDWLRRASGDHYGLHFVVSHPACPIDIAKALLTAHVDDDLTRHIRGGVLEHPDWLADREVQLAMTTGPRCQGMWAAVIPHLPPEERVPVFARLMRVRPVGAFKILEDPDLRAALGPIPPSVLEKPLLSDWASTRDRALRSIPLMDSEAAPVTPGLDRMRRPRRRQR